MNMIGVLATGAALIATAGDLLLLDVAGETAVTRLDDSGLRRVLLGHYLGVLAIPLYAAGYWQISRAVAPAGAARARWMFYVGAYAAAIGAAVHGLTALGIAVSPVSGDPVAVLAPVADYLVALWMLLGALALVGSALFATAVRTGHTPFTPWCAWLNPAVLVLAVAAAAVMCPALRPVVLPAAPNLAHVVFFGLAAVVLWRDG